MSEDYTRKRIFHITSVENITGISNDGCLWCKNVLQQRVVQPVNVSYERIQERRARKKVPVSMQGTLHDYVPWFFASRSPMLCALHHGRVENFQGGQETLVHLVSEVRRVCATELPFYFTDGHATMAFSQFFDNVMDLDKVDWEIMRDRQWADTPDDNDRRRRRQAEFGVYQSFSWKLIVGIGVANEDVASRVRGILSETVHQPPVQVCPNWYF